jgi:Leucine-rich repeat (LRR) protein
LFDNSERLRLDDNELRGLLPSEIGLLSNLEYLDFQRNILTGEIPEELGELTRLGKFCDTIAA